MEQTIVDAHAHVYPTTSWGHRRKGDHAITEYGEGKPVGASARGGDVGSVLAALDDAGVDEAVVLNLFEPGRVQADLAELPPNASIGSGAKAVAYLVWLNRWLCNATRDSGRLHPVVAVDPAVLDGDALGSHLRDCVRDGAVGVKLHTPLQGFDPDDPRLSALYRACADLGLTVIAHTGPTAPPASFAPVLAAWPNVMFVLAHAGGGIWRTTAEVVRDNPNAFVDLAEIAWWAGGAAAQAPTLRQLAELIDAVGPHRVLFGSDFPWYEPHAGLTVVRSLGLPPADEAAVLGGNASAVFRLPSAHRSSIQSGGAL